MYRFSAILVKILASYFVDIDKFLYSEVYKERQKTQNSQHSTEGEQQNWKKDKQPNFKTYHQDVVIQAMWY